MKTTCRDWIFEPRLRGTKSLGLEVPPLTLLPTTNLESLPLTGAIKPPYNFLVFTLSDEIVPVLENEPTVTTSPFCVLPYTGKKEEM